MTDEAKERRQAKQVRLTKAVQEAQTEYYAKAGEIAVTHGRSLEWVVGQLHLGGRRLARKRAVSPWSTFIARQLRKLNQGKAKGDKLSISKFLGEDGPELQDAYEKLTKSEKEALKEEGERSRSEKKVLPMRKSEKAVQKDFHDTFKAVANEVHGGLQRTQGEAIMIGVRGDVTQYGAPEIYVSPKAKAFLGKAFGMTPEQFALKLEAFVLADLGNDHTSRSKKSMNDDQSTARTWIQEGHDTLLFKQKRIKPGTVKMNYRNYEGKVVEEHKMELRGWPLPGPVQNPGHLKRQELTTLLRALENQTCRWEAMTDLKLAARIQRNQEREDRGEQVYIRRKSRKTTPHADVPSST
ncbi:hypothetical protein FA95DRAFT_1612971 [Auriscalpium vulgare]|uniref:Uncharacterized protein n=1 Tax=Auriscalpium vulgare TaxID=40419 RepID=A0ACB8R4B2_9AGAM|nr:hypothetical protein FA95DRAFT_1612971 [Auriscalpium vulgare]